ncbi:tetratricopeptide repeat protein [Psychrobacter sp.]|uniref:tetratricopeptide repeat protein n=1 Tax=Psychrobacter sp. TaxID=56811 RepID=UPI003BAEEC65
MSASPLTPLDYIAAGYWQDFLAKRPIAGGIAYEAELRHCTLDESLASLQRVDVLLSQIRRDMIKASMWDEATLLTDERYRNFMVFLAFYAGRVLAQQWQHASHWFGQFELRQRYPELSLITDDFYQHMAVSYGSDHTVYENTQNSNDNVKAPLFFALETIGLRLFGHIDRPFKSVQGGQVPSGLYQAVSARLPNSIDDKSLSITTPSDISNNASNNTPNIDKSITQSITQNSHPNVDSARAINTSQTATYNDSLLIDPLLNEHTNKESIAAIVVNDEISKKIILNKPVDTEIYQNQLQQKPEYSESALSKSPTSKSVVSKIESPLAPTIPLVATKPAATLQTAVKISPTPEIFVQLLTELDEIEVIQSAGKTEYEQARKVLDQFEQHIARQQKPRAQMVFSEAHVDSKKQALLILQDAANAGNTAAMLRLAMYELLAEGLKTDKAASADSGVEWVKQAASQNDSRAQRLLSKMYYQGVGLPQDINIGKYWLEQAAENGHAEAASLAEQWQQAQALITTQKQEQHSLKRYQILFAVIIVIALLIIFLV